MTSEKKSEVCRRGLIGGSFVVGGPSNSDMSTSPTAFGSSPALMATPTLTLDSPPHAERSSEPQPPPSQAAVTSWLRSPILIPQQPQEPGLSINSQAHKGPTTFDYLLDLAADDAERDEILTIVERLNSRQGYFRHVWGWPETDGAFTPSVDMSSDEERQQ